NQRTGCPARKGTEVSTGIRLTQIASSMLAVSLLTAAVPENTRTLIDRILNKTGRDVDEEGAYKFILPREGATVLAGDESLSPNIGLNSWFTFSSGVHREAILAGQFLLLADEVNAVLSAGLDNGLEITGLADSTLFAGPRLYTMDFTGVGTFQGLATAVRRTMDEIQVFRRKNAGKSTGVPTPNVGKVSGITGRPLDAVLAMRGAVTGGIYKAAIGRKGLLHGDPIGREMGLTTWLSFAGTDQQALSTGDMLATVDELQDL